MDPHALLQYSWQFVELRFADGRRVRAHLADIDPNATGREVVYELIETLEGSTLSSTRGSDLVTCSAESILDVIPTNRAQYAPPVSFRKRR